MADLQSGSPIAGRPVDPDPASAVRSTSLRAAAILADHPLVGEVRVDETGDLLVRPSDAALAVRPDLGPLVGDYLEQWSELYDWVYEQGDNHIADDLDLSGWRASSGTQPFPVEHMVDWIDRTVELVLRSRPRLVLELGCGTGLLMHRLRKQVAGYVGTDVSRVAVDRFAFGRLPGVVVVQAAAHEARSGRVRQALASFGGVGVRPDCVLLNSVTQHFPSARYLEAVVHDAVDMVSTGGTVVIGDVRHAGLLDHYCTWIEHELDPSAGSADIEERASARARREKEFLADPRLIAGIAARNDRAVSMAVHAKAMQADTELTRYRYDVVLQVDSPGTAPTPEHVSWSSLTALDRFTALRRRVATGRPLVVHGIPNRLLVSVPDAVSAFDLRAALTGLDTAVCMDVADPSLLSVAAPSLLAGEQSPATLSDGPEGTAHEPLRRYVAGRFPEMLRDHLRGRDPELTQVVITVE